MLYIFINSTTPWLLTLVIQYVLAGLCILSNSERQFCIFAYTNSNAYHISVLTIHPSGNLLHPLINSHQSYMWPRYKLFNSVIQYWFNSFMTKCFCSCLYLPHQCFCGILHQFMSHQGITCTFLLMQFMVEWSALCYIYLPFGKLFHYHLLKE